MWPASVDAKAHRHRCVILRHLVHELLHHHRGVRDQGALTPWARSFREGDAAVAGALAALVLGHEGLEVLWLQKAFDALDLRMAPRHRVVEELRHTPLVGRPRRLHAMLQRLHGRGRPLLQRPYRHLPAALPEASVRIVGGHYQAWTCLASHTKEASHPRNPPDIPSRAIPPSSDILWDKPLRRPGAREEKPGPAHRSEPS